ncbi:hypothetical protein LTR42_004115 [Elasticomyces elasticus]|nr:hypothetical protein LTR42_004115 [Elasticomyces elasticus]
MEQITAALKHAEDIRLEIKDTAMQFGPSMTCQPRVKEDRRDGFNNINGRYYDCLTVATLISKLCTLTANQEDHRVSRLSELLRLVKNAADELSIFSTSSWDKHGSSTADIEALGNAITRLWQGRNDAPILSEHPGSIAAYFDGGPYDLPKAPKCLRQDQGTMVIEANRVPCNQVNTQYSDYGAVNSIWYSLGEKGIIDSDDLGAYRKLCRLLPTTSLVFAKDEEVSCEDDDCEYHGHLRYDHNPSCSYKARWAPHELAIAMTDMHVDVGFVFCDDHSVIVWPLGMVHAVQGRGIVLYCRPQHHPRASCYDLGPAWCYTSLRTTGEHCEGEEHNDIQGSDVKRPKGFLDLPPELRMQFYDAYFWLASNEWHRTWWHLAEMALPQLCMVNRQLRDEVTLQWLASWKIHCESSWDSSYVADQVLDYGSYIGYQLSSRPLIRSLSINYKFHEDMIDINSSEQVRSNKNVAVYMEDGSPKTV